MDSVKKGIGIHEDYDSFDRDMIMHINTVLFGLNQMGIGINNFRITGYQETWKDFLANDQINLDAVVSWTALKVKLIFDPPISTSIKTAMDEVLKEYEWRMYITENYTDSDFYRNY